MDVDPSHSSTSFADHGGALMPRIDENFEHHSKSPKQRLIELLDILEARIEKLRKDALVLEEEKDSLVMTLDSVKNTHLMGEVDDVDKEDIHFYVDRIMNRCLTIELKIHTQRDRTQEEALHQINYLIDNLVMVSKTDPGGSKGKCIAYMNSCSSHFVEGVTDKNFESALLGCTVDDQKRVKKRLQGLLNYFDKLHITNYD